MDNLITKEEAIAYCLKRFTVNNTDRLHLEAAFGLVYESGYRDGMKFVEDLERLKRLEKTEQILERWKNEI